MVRGPLFLRGNLEEEGERDTLQFSWLHVFSGTLLVLIPSFLPCPF